MIERMPIQVDHDAQRNRVADLAAGVVAREGVGALTFRRMADEAGTSTAIVSTYFADKQDLLVTTLRTVATRTSIRFDSAMSAGAGLQECLEAWLPLDAARLDDWRVIIAFWGAAVADADLAAVQDGHVRRARGRVSKHLSGADTSARAHQIVALTLGVALQAVFGRMSQRQQRRLLADCLERLTT